MGNVAAILPIALHLLYIQTRMVSELRPMFAMKEAHDTGQLSSHFAAGWRSKSKILCLKVVL